MANINTVLYDLGNVLIDWNPMYVFHDMFDDPKDLDFFFENVCTMDWNENQDAGALIADATAEKVAEFPEWKVAIEAYYGRWTEMLGGQITRSVDIQQAIKATGRYQLLALTNWSAELFPIALDRYAFLHDFEGIVVSGEEKVRKPDPRIYQIVCDRYGAVPEQTVFIDDSLRNIKASIDLGFHGIHFQNPTQLKGDLMELGVEI